ncbi:MAG: FAD-dependent oxidoreductase, partial [Pseudomonas sp.]
MELRADLLIVGAGMVGSALALALQGSGLQVLLLDGSPMSVKPFDPQA